MPHSSSQLRVEKTFLEVLFASQLKADQIQGHSDRGVKLGFVRLVCLKFGTQLISVKQRARITITHPVDLGVSIKYDS